MKRTGKILLIIAIVLLTLSGTLWAVLSRPGVQSWLISKITTYAAEQLKTTIAIKEVDADLFNHLVLKGVVLKDQKQDTLLSAGAIKLYLSDLFFFKKTATLNSIGLENVKLNCSRGLKDSVFNYQFILDALASKDTTTAKSPWKLTVKKIQLADVQFNYHDTHTQFIDVGLASAQIVFKQTDFANKKIVVDDISIAGATTCITAMNFISEEKKAVATKSNEKKIVTTHINPDNWYVQLDRLNVTRSAFAISGRTPDSSKVFSPQNFILSNVNLDFKNILLNADTLKGTINELSAREAKGFELSSLTTQFKITPQEMELAKFAMLTPNSKITNYFALQFSTPDDLNSFVENVSFKANFDESKIGMADVNYFATLPDYLKDALQINGKISGTVGNLKGSNLELQMGANYFKGKFKIKNLPDVNNMYIDFTTEQLTSSGTEVLKFLPKTENKGIVQRVGDFNFHGNFTGFIKDFVAQGSLYTSIGSVSSDLNLKINDRNKLIYSGSLSSNQFNLGTLLDRKDLLGELTFNADINGQGWLNDNPKANIKGSIAAVDINHYHYTQIDLDGLFQQKEFTGNIKSTDANADLLFNGTVDFSDSLPKFDFKSTIKHIDFFALHISSEKYELANTDVVLHASGNTIDNFTGSANIQHLFLKKESKEAHVKSLICSSENFSGGKKFNIQSDFLTGNVTGKFNYDQLPAALTTYLHQYFPTYVPLMENQKNNLRKQQFDFAIEVKKDAELVKFFVPALKEFSTIHANGKFNNDVAKMSLSADASTILINNIRIDELAINAQSSQKLLFSEITCNAVTANDTTVLIPGSRLKFTARQDSLAFTFEIAGDTADKQINLKGLTVVSTNTISTNLLPSAIFIKGKKWQIENKNLLTYSNGIFNITDLYFAQGSQKISFNTFEDSSTFDHLKIVITDLKIGEMGFAITSNKTFENLKGIANGNIEVKNIFEKPIANADLRLTDVVMNNDTIGLITAKIKFDDAAKKVYSDLTMKNNFSQMDASGYYQMNDSINPLHYVMHLDAFNLRYIEPLISGILSKKSGVLTGDVQVTGSPRKPNVVADCMLNNAGVTVNYLNTHYTFDKVHVTAANSIISMEKFTIKDSLFNSGTFWGSINLQNMKAVTLDLNVNTKNLMVMNTDYEQNNLFYGKAFAGGDIKISGVTYSLTIAANATTNKGTQLFIPITDDKDVAQHDFIEFISSRDTAKHTIVKKYKEDLDGITLDFDFDVTPDAEVTMIMDLAAGDYVRAQGSGNIKINYSTISTFDMFGNYTINKGDYFFTFLNASNKNFNINKGSSITWNGNPYNANVDITASYLTKAPFYDLLPESFITTATSAEITYAKKPTPVNVEMIFTGSLIQPDINFDIKLPSTNNNSQVSFIAIQQLQKIKEDQNEMNNQVFGLLILNQFLPTSQNNTSDASNPFTSVYKNTLTELASIQASQRLNKAYYQFTKDDKTQFNFNYRNYTDATTTDVRNYNEFGGNFSRRFFNDRLTIDGGVIYDYGKTNTNNNNLAGDFLLEYKLLNNLTLKGFRKTEYDILSESNKNRTGIGLSYHREFDSFSDLWMDLIRKK